MKKLFVKSYSLFELLAFISFTIVLLSILSYRKILDARKEIEVPVVEISLPEKQEGNFYRNNYDFTQDWFIKHIPIWKQVLSPFAGKPDLQYLEIGVFEGRSAVWMLENILTHPSSHLTGMDLFAGDYEGHYPKFAERYFANIEKTGAADRTTTIKGFSQVELRKLPLNHYDIIYIDGSHENKDVLEDAILSMRLLKPSGILIFDDYCRSCNEYGAPRVAIDSFVRYYGDSFDVLHNGYQIVLRKKESNAK